MSGNEKIFIPMDGDCTTDLQQAINEAARQNRRLVLGAGLHRCGFLILPSNLDLYFAEGATLSFVEAYEVYRANRVEVMAESSNTAMMSAFGCHSIRLSGPGRIQAPGEAYIVARLDDMGTHIPAAERPRVLVLHSCKSVTLDRFSIFTSPMWTVHLVDCSDVNVVNLKIDNDREMPNTDGIVVDSCQNVVIRHCDIATADDGVVLKTSLGRDGKPVGPCRNIRVEHCKVESRSCALKIGTETFSDIEDVTFSDCDVVRSNRAIGIFSRDGGNIRDIKAERVRVDARETPDGFWGSGEAITVNVVDRRPERPAGCIENISFDQIEGTMEGAINLVADGKAGIQKVILRRISVQQKDGPYKGHRYDMRPTHFDLAPSSDAAGRANAWVKDDDGQVIGLVPYPGGFPALFSSNVEGLVLDDVYFNRPDPLMDTWSKDPIVIRTGDPSVWS